MNFAILNSDTQSAWAYKNSSMLESRLRYTPSDSFETFPFPPCLRPSHPLDEAERATRAALERVGTAYYELRAALMRDLNLGLTKTYNLFHDAALDEAAVAKALEKSGGTGTAADCLARLVRLRELHADMDREVLKAYGWASVDPKHGFYELDFLPENDRVRYTICPEARRDVLERLLELNFQRHAEEAAKGVAPGKAGGGEEAAAGGVAAGEELAEPKKRGRKNAADGGTGELF